MVCLIRKRTGRSNDDVLKENLRNYGLLRRLEAEHLERVETVTGDLTKVGFGVDRLTYENLLLKSDGIVHCAAIVSLAETFENLYLANVQGTKEVVKLSCFNQGYVWLLSSRGIHFNQWYFSIEAFEYETIQTY